MTPPKSPVLKIGSEIRLANLRKSKSVGTIVGFLSEDKATKSFRGVPQNWQVQLKHDGSIIFVSTKQILKVLA